MSNLTEVGAAAVMAVLDLTGLYAALGVGQSSAGLVGEFTGGDYARVACGGFTKSGRFADNDNPINFPTLSATLGTATHIGLYDASSAGDCVWVGSLSTATDLTSGEAVGFAAGALVVEIPVAVG